MKKIISLMVVVVVMTLLSASIVIAASEHGKGKVKTERCGNNKDDDKDGLIDEYCLPAGASCTYSWQCQTGLVCNAFVGKCG